MNRRRIALAAPFLALALALALLASPAFGAKRVSPKFGPSAVTKLVKSRSGSSKRRSGGGGCTQATPGLAVDNTFGWGQWGSWGVAGQQRMYFVRLMNNDVGCGSSTFLLSATAPSGFAVSIPTQSITLSSASSGHVSAYVTSPIWAADGDYPLSFTIQRASSPDVSSATYYKVYSSDSALPTLFWPNPWDGTSISGRSYNVTVSSSDDHQVTKLELYLDDAQAPTATTLCDGVAYNCQLFYTWAIRRVHGQHSATFKSYDWLGNAGTLTTTFNVN